MTPPRLILSLLLGLSAFGSLAAHAEDEKPVEEVTLRIAPTGGDVLLFRRTLTLRCTSTVGESSLPAANYDVVQDLRVTTASSQPGKHVFSVECIHVEVTATMDADEGPEKGFWTSASPELQMDDDSSILCAASAMGIGRVLAGTTNELTVDDRAEKVGVALSRETRALEKETGRSSSFAPSLLEGIAWRPFFVIGRLPEKPVKTGATFTRDVSWAAAMPKRAVHGPVEMHVKSADANRVVLECDAVPRLHLMRRVGVIEEALPEKTFADARVTGQLTLSAKDGLPIDTTWTVAGTYIHHVAFWGEDDLHEKVELTVRVERVD